MMIFLKILALFMSILFLTFVYMFISHFILKNKNTEKQNDKENLMSDFFVPISYINTTRALIACNRITPEVPSLFQVSGYADCHTLHSMFQGNMLCRYGCLGLGSCAHVCPADAIIIKNGSIFVTDSCNGCGNCITECPKQLISLIPINSKNQLLCAAHLDSGDYSFCPTGKNGYLLD